jgi:hypothetical protein
MAVTLNTSLQNLQADSWADDLDSGFIDIYTGAQPAANASPSGTLLVSVALDVAAYDAAVAGVAEIPSAVNGIAVAAGDAGYAQQRNAANTRWQYAPVSATPGAGVVALSTLTIGISDTVTISTSTITQAATT